MHFTEFDTMADAKKHFRSNGKKTLYVLVAGVPWKITPSGKAVRVKIKNPWANHPFLR